jgi:hypothetical protein
VVSGRHQTHLQAYSLEDEAPGVREMLDTQVKLGNRVRQGTPVRQGKPVTVVLASFTGNQNKTEIVLSAI